MKKKIAWLVIIGGMVAALLLASCAPAAVKEEEKKVAPPQEKKEEVVVPKEVAVPKEEANMVKWTGTKLDGTVVEKMIEKPRYGGLLLHVLDTQPQYFDEGLRTSVGGTGALDVTNEELMGRMWTRGPLGTGEWSALYSGPASLVGTGEGVLAESWELPDTQTAIFHIRKGVRYALDPTNEASRLVAGRELTAADVVWSLRREWTISYHSRTFRILADMKNLENSIYVSPTDKWTVVIKTEPGYAWFVWERVDTIKLMVPEVIEKYGPTITDWKRTVGTGPFILKEYVGASSLAYVRNPNYWMKDPFFPENQLPYLDGIKILIIPDLSTRLAALRTGKIDELRELESEDAEALMRTSPELKWNSYLPSPPTMYMRNDIKPFNDIKVRRALSMSINKRELTDVYYGGKAELFPWPVPPIADFMDLYIPLEQMPESVKELYNYNLEKARLLLADAGYPKGFKTKVLVTPANVDFVSILKEYWAKIGVDITLDVQDPTVFSRTTFNRAYEMRFSSIVISTTQAGQSGYLIYERPGDLNNSNVFDPWVMEQYNAVNKAYGENPKLGRQLKNRESIIYRLDQAWFITLPAPYRYDFWQPWLKNYGGIYTGFFNELGYPDYVWIDQELKKAMGR